MKPACTAVGSLLKRAVHEKGTGICLLADICLWRETGSGDLQVGSDRFKMVAAESANAPRADSIDMGT